MVAGCEISVSIPPRLSPSEQSLTARRQRSAASREHRADEIHRAEWGVGALARAEVERDQRAEAALLALVDGVAGMVLEAGPVHARDLLLSAQELRDRPRVLLVPRPAQRERA